VSDKDPKYLFTPRIGEITVTRADEFPPDCPRRGDCVRREEEFYHMIERIQDEKREDHKEMWDAIKKTNESVANLAGRVVGYTMTGSIVVGIVAFVAAKVFH
jgi:hypothetical protein